MLQREARIMIIIVGQNQNDTRYGVVSSNVLTNPQIES